MNSTVMTAALSAMIGVCSTAAFAMPAWRIDGRRATEALNMLEAKGDGGFTDFHAVGRDFAANVMRDGRTIHLLVHPNLNRIQTQMT